MDRFSRRLNQMLVETFRGILKMEERSLHSINGRDLSMSEMHLLEAAVGRDGEGATITQLAQALEITPPSVTVAVNRLEQKGYVEKRRSVEDARRVHVAPTRQGHKIVQAHRHFHESMIGSMTAELSEEEKQAMLSGVEKLCQFFARKTGDRAHWSDGPEGDQA